MLCEHGNIAPCVECDIEPLKAENAALKEENERLKAEKVQINGKLAGSRLAVSRLEARVAELEEGIARCRQQASYCIGNEEALKNQLSKVRDIANDLLAAHRKGGE